MHLVRAVIIFLLILVTGFSSAYAQESAVGPIYSKVEKFDFSLVNDGYGNIWDMTSLDFQARVKKKDYVGYLKYVLGVSGAITNSKFATIVIYNDSLAVSQHVITVKKDRKVFGDIICQTIIWERTSGEWRINQFFPCENKKVIFSRQSGY